MTFLLCDLLDVTVVVENITISFLEERSITHNILLSLKCLSDYVYTAKSQVEIQFTWLIELIFRQPKKIIHSLNLLIFSASLGAGFCGIELLTCCLSGSWRQTSLSRFNDVLLCQKALSAT